MLPQNPSRSTLSAAATKFWFSKEGVARALYDRLRAKALKCALVSSDGKWGVAISGNRPIDQSLANLMAASFEHGHAVTLIHHGAK